MQSIYSASKFALHGFTDALRMELEADGLPVSVTLIHPGRIDTPYNEHARSYMKHQPAHHGMIYAPEAVAAVIGGIAPRLTDLIMERIMFRNQVSTTAPPAAGRTMRSTRQATACTSAAPMKVSCAGAASTCKPPSGLW